MLHINLKQYKLNARFTRLLKKNLNKVQTYEENSFNYDASYYPSRK